MSLRHGADARRLRRQEPDRAQAGITALAEVLPNAELRELEGVSHNVMMNVLAPVLAEFYTGEADAGVPAKTTSATATS